MIEVFEKKYLIDTELSDLREHEQTISDTMLRAVSSHDDESDHFSALEHDPDTFHFQRADCVVATGEAANVDKFSELAPGIFPDFNKSVDRFMDTRGDLLTHSADILANGNDLHVVTDHRNVIGVAVGSCIVAAALYESGKVDHGDIDTHIAVSNMLKYTAIHGYPGVWLLQDIFTSSNFVYPGINQQNRAMLPKELVERFNASSNEARKHDKEKPALVAVAGSATRDIKIHNPLLPASKKKGYYMGPPSNGTVEEYMADSYVLGMGLDIAKGDRGVLIDKIWVPTAESIARIAIMQHIADGMTEQTGVRSFFVSSWKEFQELKQQS